MVGEGRGEAGWRDEPAAALGRTPRDRPNRLGSRTMLTTTFCAALSAAGLAIAVLTAYRRRYLRATRIAAVALLPVGLAMAGLVTLGRKITTAVGDWAADLVFKPSVWTGFAVLACSAGLYGITRLFAGRGGGRGGDRGTDRAAEPAGLSGAGSGTPAALGASRNSGGAGRADDGAGRGAAKPKKSRGGDSGLSGFEDVEEILRRRGI